MCARRMRRLSAIVRRHSPLSGGVLPLAVLLGPVRRVPIAVPIQQMLVHFNKKRSGTAGRVTTSVVGGLSPTCPLEPRTPLRKGERLRDKIEAQLGRLKAAPRLIQSFFRAPSVAYITDR
jgi:hypothetical protein